MPYNTHLDSYKTLITPYSETRAGFIALALEKNKKATPFIEEAKALKAIALTAAKPKDLFQIKQIYPSLLTASGISDKAKNHLDEKDKDEAIRGLIEKFLEPSGKEFVDELVYRFLLTRGDTLGGSMRNLAGAIGEWKFTRILISTLSIFGYEYFYLDSHSSKWFAPDNRDDIDRNVKALSWKKGEIEKVLLYNIKVPSVDKNVDLVLLNTEKEVFLSGVSKRVKLIPPEQYVALGEIKGGIDPAGADEHWKTANSALKRIRDAFKKNHFHPQTFFVGAAIESSMAEEIYTQLRNGELKNAANLTNEQQVVSLCSWLINL